MFDTLLLSKLANINSMGPTDKENWVENICKNWKRVFFFIVEKKIIDYAFNERNFFLMNHIFTLKQFSQYHNFQRLFEERRKKKPMDGTKAPYCTLEYLERNNVGI
jgi:hypothetical protein